MRSNSFLWTLSARNLDELEHEKTKIDTEHVVHTDQIKDKLEAARTKWMPQNVSGGT